MASELIRQCSYCNSDFKVSPVNQYTDRPDPKHIYCSANCRHCKKAERYRQDPEFNKKKAIITRDRYRWRNKRKECKNCNSKENLEIHHITYFKDPNEIIVLCRPCHRAIHNGNVEEEQYA